MARGRDDRDHGNGSRVDPAVCMRRLIRVAADNRRACRRDRCRRALPAPCRRSGADSRPRLPRRMRRSTRRGAEAGDPHRSVWGRGVCTRRHRLPSARSIGQRDRYARTPRACTRRSRGVRPRAGPLIDRICRAIFRVSGRRPGVWVGGHTPGRRPDARQIARQIRSIRGPSSATYPSTSYVCARRASRLTCWGERCAHAGIKNIAALHIDLRTAI